MKSDVAMAGLTALVSTGGGQGLRIGIVSTMRGYEWAGSEELWHATALHGIQNGCCFDLFLHREVGMSAQVAELVRQGARIWPWTVSRFARFQNWKERIAPSFPGSRLDACDVILISLGSLPSACYTPGLIRALLETRRPFVLLCQFNSDHLAISPHERAELRELISRAAACVFVSEHNLDVTRRQFAVEPPRATVILNPAREKRQEPLPWPACNGCFHLACVARFEVLWKGQDLLLDVLRSERWRDRPWRLHFYGDGPDLDHIRKLTTFFGLEDRVSFEGYIRDLTSIWSQNHLLVLPSHGEGTPLVVLEAMMFGRPVVTTDVGGNREVLEDEVTGFIAESASPRSFGAAVERAWQARDRWPGMGRTAHARAKELAGADPPQELLDVVLGCVR